MDTIVGLVDSTEKDGPDRTLTFGVDLPDNQSVNRSPMPDRRLDVAEQLRGLQQLSTAGLKALWIEIYGRPPPFRVRRELIVPMLAYRLQEQAEGGLSAATRKRLRVLAHADGPRRPRASVALKPGTRLVREWQGHTHVVSVLENAVEYRGERYRSLSEVARVITGTRWSGPAFFGLNAVSSPPRSLSPE